MAWGELPKEMRSAAAELLGSPVVEATTQNGGFSPGSADRVVTADGRHAFIKTALESANAESARLHAREAAVVAALPDEVPVPASFGVVERDGWVLAAYEDVAGRQPATPWRAEEIRAVFDAFASICARPVESDLREMLPTAASDLERDLRDASWRDIPHLEILEHGSWIAAAADSSLGDYSQFLADLEGDRLVHLDARADNLLVRADGSVVIVDWPWAGVGPSWVDPLTIVLNVAYFAPNDDASGWFQHDVFADVSPEILARFLFHVAGMFLANSEKPTPPGIPGLRAFQREQGVASLRLARALVPLG